MRLPIHSTRLAGFLTTLLILAGGAAIYAYMPLQLLAIATILIASTMLLLRIPWLLWIILAFALPVASSLKVGPGSTADIILLLGFGLWYVDGVRRRTLGFRLTILHLPLALYCFALALSLLSAPNLGEASVEVIKWVEFALLLAVLPEMLPQRRVTWLVWALLFAAVSQALLGLYQFVFQIGPDWFVIMDRFMRASGTFQQPNPYAGYLGLTAPVAISLAIWSWRRTLSGTSCAHDRLCPKLGMALLYTGVGGLLVLGMLASWSRGAWLGIFAAIIVVVMLHSRMALIVFIATLPFVGLLFAGSEALLTRLPEPISARVQEIPAYLGAGDLLNQPLTDENFAIAERLAHWVAALRMWESAPWFGIGPGNYSTVYPDVRLLLWEEPLGHAHNIYLNVLAESGLIGLAAYMLLWGIIMVWTWRYICHSSQAATSPNVGIVTNFWNAGLNFRGAVAIGVLGVFAHLTIHNFFDNLFVQGNYLHIALWLAALVTMSGAPNRSVLAGTGK